MTAPEPVRPARRPDTQTSAPPAPPFTILAAGGAGVCEGNVCQVPPLTHAPDDEPPAEPPDQR
jgi:hypothetical protein